MGVEKSMKMFLRQTENFIKSGRKDEEAHGQLPGAGQQKHHCGGLDMFCHRLATWQVLYAVLRTAHSPGEDDTPFPLGEVLG